MPEKRPEIDPVEALKSTIFIQEAIITLLEKKNLMTREEIMTEIKKLRLAYQDGLPKA